MSQPQHELIREPRIVDPTAVTWIDPESLTFADQDDSFTGIVLAESLDKSLGGIGLVFDSRPLLETGQELTLTHNGASRTAVVRNIVPLDSGQFRVGFQWKEPAEQA